MLERLPRVRFNLAAMVGLLLPPIIAGCFAAHRLKEITRNPYPLTQQDDSVVRFSDADDDVLIEVRKAKISKPLDNLAIHYGTLFPGSEVIRPGDKEEYVKIGDRKAYKVVFRTTYIRKRKRLDEGKQITPEEEAQGWKTVTMTDPETGGTITALYGPIIPRERILYLVEGDTHVYYVFLRADGDAIDSAREKFEKFVREEIKYG